MPDPFWYQGNTTTGYNATTTGAWTTWTGQTVAYQAWPYWIDGTVTTGSTYYGNAWGMWVIQPETVPETEEQRAEREERQRQEAAEYQRRASEENARREAAAARAREILRDHLTAEQAEALERRRAFHVIASDGEEYEIEARGHSGNVRRIVGGRAVERLCIHAYSEMPDEDHWLSQKLLLEADAETFRQIANITRVA